MTKKIKALLVLMTFCMMFTHQVKADEIPNTNITIKTAMATGYCLEGITATGTVSREGVIAYMPQFYGSTILVFEDIKGDGITIDPKGYIGTYSCEDTGKESIKRGFVCDLRMKDYQTCMDFGSKKVILVIIPSEG